MNDNAKRRLAELAHLIVHDALSPDEHAELEAILKTNSDARSEYFLLLDLEYGLAKLAEEHQSEPPPSFAKTRPVTASAEKPSLAIYGPLIALSLALLLIVPWAIWNRQAPSVVNDPSVEVESPEVAVQEDPQPAIVAQPVMQLAQLARGRFFGEAQSPAAGDALQLNHDYALAEGSVQLRSQTGAEMIVQAPAVFNVQSAERVLLKMGTCSVYAPDGAEGFQVLTPKAVVVDKGTRFSIHVNETGEADVEVIEGAAELFAVDEKAQPQKDGLMLAAGEGRVVNSLGEIAPGNKDRFGHNYQASLPDRVVDFKATGPEAAEPDQLVNLTVQRGGQTYEYDVDQLIGFELIHFRSGRNSQNMTTPNSLRDPVEGDGSRTRAELLDHDRSLATGLLNPGGSVEPLTADPDITNADLEQRTPGFAVRFHQPVINGPGPDVVYFDLQVVVHPEQGDPFHVSPMTFETGLHSHSIRQFDISLADRQAHTLSGFRLYGFEQPIRSVEELLIGKHNGGVTHAAPAKIIAVGIDLSDLGYTEGAEVEALFFQDMLDDNNVIDPVFIGGLPPTSTTSSSLEK
ncbi:hypothetical protein DTL21_10695 [Bremerella cremea]|uniref:FecR protein domain-containing protein n=1 Tax=Blastopirellula marina TaxID=124 RepID=A0A2S8FVZ6_9BACT|nr:MULTISPECIES: hypothetical protein [Pirellulaceae]PQO36356.1 hypothetical protein C5Y83_10690 [Blastopirellula marina]RCS49034.1 hypothetical protein DTL21_10695 [Bremerella cremea]